MSDGSFTLETEVTLNMTLTVREWAYVAGVLGSAIELAERAANKKGGMPDEVAHITASAVKLREMILDETAKGISQ